MKVKELLIEIEEKRKQFGDEFLEYDIYTEQLSEIDKQFKRDKKWETFTDSEKWEYFKCFGYYTTSLDKKLFTINVNY